MRVGRLQSAGGAVVGLIFLLGACAQPAPVPTYRVVRRDFSQRVAAEGFLSAAEATQVVIPPDVRHGGRIVWMEQDGSEVEAGQVLMRLDHYELEQELAAQLVELESAQVERRRTAVEGRAAVETAATRKDIAGLELGYAERFRRTDAELFSRNEIVDSEIAEDLARTQREHAIELENIESDRTRAQLERVDIDRRKAGFEVDLARAALAALELRAPARGILVWSRDWNGEIPRIGEQVFRGQVVAEIPDLSVLDAEAFVLEADAGGVAAGQPAEITIDAHPERNYAARVLRVAPVAKRRFRGSPVQYIGVTLALPDLDPALMKPGQRVTASIVVREEPAALVLPRQALFAEEGSFFVYRASGGAFLKREVDVRAAATGLALVGAGLEEDDQVALVEPASAGERPAEPPRLLK